MMVNCGNRVSQRRLLESSSVRQNMNSRRRKIAFQGTNDFKQFVAKEGGFTPSYPDRSGLPTNQGDRPQNVVSDVGIIDIPRRLRAHQAEAVTAFSHQKVILLRVATIQGPKVFSVRIKLHYISTAKIEEVFFE